MTDFNLEEEYGSFLDFLEVYLSQVGDEPVEHFGVKGMKWGVRKDRSSNREGLKSIGPDQVTRKTSSGETITIQKVTPNRLQEFLGRHNKNFREDHAKQATVNILDGSGKKVGDAFFQKKNDEELYLEWLGIKKSARGNGYATAVMKAARDFGQHEGFKRMVLEVPESSHDAQHIYTKLGFKIVDGDSSTWGSNMVYEFDETSHAATSYLEKPDLNELAELVHYGIKGMRWGVHKRQEAHAAELQAAKERAKVGGYFGGGQTKGGGTHAVGKTTKQIKREVAKAKGDAEEYARAKMFYGEGAGNRRKRIKAIINSRSRGNPEYHKAFQQHLDAQNMEKHANKARGERRRKDVKNSTTKTARGISHYLRGNPQYASAAAAMIAGGALAAHKAGVDKVVLKAGKTALKNFKGTNIKPGMTASEFLKHL